MLAWFSWILDARLHIVLIVSLVATVIGQLGSTREPAGALPYIKASAVIADQDDDGTPTPADAPGLAGDSLTPPEVAAERP